MHQRTHQLSHAWGRSRVLWSLLPSTLRHSILVQTVAQFRCCTLLASLFGVVGALQVLIPNPSLLLTQHKMQSRDSVQNFLEVADSWNITDGVSHSLAVSRDVHCNSAPFKHSAYDRTVLHQGLLRAVATEAINYILQRKTPVASVVHEQYMPVHEQVALVGELRVVPRSPALRPLTTNSVSMSLQTLNSCYTEVLCVRGVASAFVYCVSFANSTVHCYDSRERKREQKYSALLSPVLLIAGLMLQGRCIARNLMGYWVIPTREACWLSCLRRMPR